MNNHIYDLKAEGLFPFPIPLFGYILIAGSFLSLIATIYAFPILLILGVAILSARRGIEFDREHSTIREYYSFFYLLKIGKKEHLGEVEKIFINASKVSQQVNTMVTSGITSRSTEFNAYLKLVNGKKYFLLSGKKKKNLLEKIYPLEVFLETQLFDNSQRVL